jgi:hypothetical protein
MGHAAECCPISRMVHWLPQTHAQVVQRRMLAMTLRMLATLLPALAWSVTAVAGPLPDGPYVSTSASAVEEVPPDFAVLDMAFRTVEPTPERARARTDAAQRALLDVLEAFTDAVRDRRIESMSFGEEIEFDRDQGRQVTVGHFGRFSVRIEVDDFDALPDLHYRLAGLQWRSLSNPAFRVDDRDAVENRLRQRALAAARDRARVLAEAGSTSLGSLWGVIHEPMHELAGRLPGDRHGPSAPLARAAEGDGRFAWSVQPRPVTFEATVGVVYRLATRQ